MKQPVESPLSTWISMQQELWDNYLTILHNAPQLQNLAAGGEQWAQLRKEWLRAWSGHAGTPDDETTPPLFGDPAALLRLLEATAKAWQSIGPALDAGQDWRPLIEQYTRTWLEPWLKLSKQDELGQQLIQQWSAGLESWLRLSQPWLEAPQPGAAAKPGDSGFDMMRLLTPDWEAAARSYAGLGEIPQVGLDREVRRKWLELTEVWLDCMRLNSELQVLKARTTAKLFQRFMEELVELNRKGETIDSLRQLLETWTRVGDKTIVEVYRSEEFLDVQGRLSRAVLTYKIKLRTIVEDLCKAFNIPTRSELDDAYRVIYELRKDLNALKKTLRDRDREAAAAPKAPARRSKSTPGKPD